MRDAVHKPLYAWRDLRFTPPDGVDDDTLVTFSAPDAGWNLTVARDTLIGSLEAYARAQEQALAARRPAGYSASAPVVVVVDGRQTVRSDRSFQDARGQALRQRQIFVGVAQGVVALVTATARGKDAERAFAAADTVVRSLHIVGPSNAGDRS